MPGPSVRSWSWTFRVLQWQSPSDPVRGFKLIMEGTEGDGTLASWGKVRAVIRNRVTAMVYKNVMMGEFGLLPQHLRYSMYTVGQEMKSDDFEYWLLGDRHELTLNEMMSVVRLKESCPHNWESRSPTTCDFTVIVGTISDLHTGTGPCYDKCRLMWHCLCNTVGHRWGPVDAVGETQILARGRWL